MIPTIGAMIGFYILTEMLLAMGNKKGSTIVNVFAVINSIVVIGGLISLF